MIKKFEFLRDLYYFREQDLLKLIDVVNLREDNLDIQSAKFYDFILSTSPLLERTGKLFFEFFNEPVNVEEDFLGSGSQFVLFLLNQRSSYELKINNIPTRTVEVVPGPNFNLVNVTIELKHRYFFDEEDLLIRPFNGLKEKDEKFPKSKFSVMPFWNLYLGSKHEHKNYSEIFPTSNLENALCCLGSSYLLLRFISYELLATQIGHRDNTRISETRKLTSFFKLFKKEGPVKTSQNNVAISHASDEDIYTGPLGGELAGYQGQIQMPSEIFKWYYWTTKKEGHDKDKI
ncbi:Uncharacterised protein [Candidatus Bilamarchaeum dharawalense]|uniref:Uncharacterized protein n=1 Tax=Candidatus Bilamarchaeum dharawalense TaxID=2885759 RepID=A0A5E4LSV8_9ARCH|nr:Uncharacterised protein [Candidatus Bilamarchaeum dharawalense]